MGECGFGDGFEGGRLFLYKEIKENLKERRRGGGPVVEFDVSLAKCVHSVECCKWCNWK